MYEEPPSGDLRQRSIRPAVATILLAEDSPTQALALKGLLEASGYTVGVAPDGEEAFRIASRNRPDLIISDVLMPRMDGFQLCRRIRAEPDLRDIPFLLRSAVYGAEEDRAFARAVGVDAYVEKSADIQHLIGICAALLAGEVRVHRSAILADDVFQTRYSERMLSRLLEEVTQVERASEQLAATFEATLQSLVAALDLRDAETEAHSWRVTDYALRIGEELLGPSLDTEALRRGSLLHDIGKIGVPDHILRKPGPLDDLEWKVMRKHPTLGYMMVAGLDIFGRAGELILSHHERWDGEGYPQGLQGADIPVVARIFSVADAIDAITSNRPYRAGRGFGVAMDAVRSCSGTQFDPEMAEAALGIPIPDWEERKRHVETAVALRRTEKERALFDQSGGQVERS